MLSKEEALSVAAQNGGWAHEADCFKHNFGALDSVAQKQLYWEGIIGADWLKGLPAEIQKQIREAAGRDGVAIFDGSSPIDDDRDYVNDETTTEAKVATEEQRKYREYLRQNAHDVGGWPSWKKDGARGVSVLDANENQRLPDEKVVDKTSDIPKPLMGKAYFEFLKKTAERVDRWPDWKKPADMRGFGQQESEWTRKKREQEQNAASDPQPPPQKNERPAVWDMVIERMRSRDETGLRRYGMRLQPFNGRDALTDAKDEALDLAVYLEQLDMERYEMREKLRQVVKTLSMSDLLHYNALADPIQEVVDWMGKAA